VAATPDTPALAPHRQTSAPAPAIKPTNAPADAAQATAMARPIRLGARNHARPRATPPPVFYENDIRRIPPAPAPPAEIYARDIDNPPVREIVRLERGETFVEALGRAGVGAAERHAAATALGRAVNLRRLKAGQAFELVTASPNITLYQLASADISPERRLLSVDFRPDAERRVILRRVGGDFNAETRALEVTTRVAAIRGRIDGSLYASAKAVGAPDRAVINLANIFAFDVDFQREIRAGDEFEALFEVQYDDEGELVAAGDVLFARLTWRSGREEKGYYRFMAGDGGKRPDYFDRNGEGAKRLLMKTPIDGARLSSGFGRRRHPILGYARAHKGVDFAAPRGTPIYAAGDGVIERIDRYGSFGNYIRIRHTRGYKTAYAHLNGFRRGLRRGSRVEQGQVIGYVGTTGRSTGPHLHYEVHLNGKAVNPQRLKIATGVKLKGDELLAFQRARDEINVLRPREVSDARLESAGGGL